MDMKSKFAMLALLVAGFQMTACTDTKEVKLDVMSFNIRLDTPIDSLNSWQYRKDNAAKMITYYAPDILGMQEVKLNQRDDLMERLPQYSALGVGRDDGKEKGEFCSLFYKTERFNLLKYGNFSLSENPDSIGVKSWDSAYPRMVTWAVLQDKTTGKKVAAFNTHFDHRGKVAQSKSAELILTKIAEIAQGLPVVLTGDFNVIPTSEPVQHMIAGGLKNACAEATITYGPAWSFHDYGRVPLEKRRLIDYVFTNGSVSVDKYRVISEQPDGGFLSDHAPVLASVTLR